MNDQPIGLPTWPDEAELAVSLTFDVDAESSLIGKSPAYRSRLSSMSDARYGITRGVPRLLDLLREHEVLATFYVPGYTAELHPQAVEAILAAGHEVGHHGYLHLRPDQVDAATQREEIERGVQALVAATGSPPAGYRSPAWELTPETLALLHEYEFAYDSSAMGDDRPYLLETEGGRLLELPVHWSLDDVPYFAFSGEFPARFGEPDSMRSAWLAELASARRDRRHVTLTMHPEIIGRGYRAEQLRRLIEEIQSQGAAWFGRHCDVASLIMRPPAIVERQAADA